MGELLGMCGAIGSGKTTFAECLLKTEPSHALYETFYVVAEIADAFNKALAAELMYATAKDPVELTNQVLIWLPDAISESLHHDVVVSHLAFTQLQTRTQPELFEKLFTYLKEVEVSPTLVEQPINAVNKEAFRPLLQWLGGYLVAKVSKTIWYSELMRRIELHEQDTKMIVVTGVRYPSDAEVIREHGGKVLTIERPGHKDANNDLTEASRSGITADVTVVNNGSIAQLQTTAENLWRDLTIGAAKSRYSAKP